MTRVGLTGGIGSGKTTVAKIFKILGIPIYYADDRAKYLIDNDVDLKESIVNEFGAEVVKDGAIDKSYLASEVFSDSDKLSKLNALVHPAVRRDYLAWSESSHGDVPYTIKEAAILFETGGHREMDFNILVTAPEDLRVERVMKRDGAEEAEVRARMSKQWLDEDKLPFADYVVINDGDYSLIEQVLALHKSIVG